MPVCPLSPGVLRSFSRTDGRLLALAPQVCWRQATTRLFVRHGPNEPQSPFRPSLDVGRTRVSTEQGFPYPALSLARGPSCTYTLTFLVLVTTSSPGEPCVRSRPLMQLPLFPLLNHNRSVGIQGTDSTYNSASSRKHIRWSVYFRI